jgi:CDP-paratose 2-epimerase
MPIAVITGSAGLIGSESVAFFVEKGFDVVGIDNDMRAHFFGRDASTAWNRDRLLQRFGRRYRHFDIDIRDRPSMEEIFRQGGVDIDLVIHAAAQPSHDWAARDPLLDFEINATGTLNLLELVRRHCPEAVFIFTSTNKVYGDRPNTLPLLEADTRWELPADHPFYRGIDETMSIDQSMHSVFGASKVAADILVQEYGRYFGLKTGCFRGGCLTGPAHSGAQLHGFLAHLMSCTVSGAPYTVFGFGGKQVRDNIHSFDTVTAFYEFYRAPRPGEVYNIGGSRHAHCSMLEAIGLCEEIAGRPLNWTYSDQNRAGDHIWYISDVSKFRSHYPEWEFSHDLRDMLLEIHEAQATKLNASPSRG